MEPFIEFHLRNGNKYWVKVENIRGVQCVIMDVVNPYIIIELFDTDHDAYWEIEVVESLEEIRQKFYKAGVFVY